MPLIKYAKIISQQEGHGVFIGFSNGFKIYKWKDDGCNFAPLEKTWWELEAWSIGHRTYRLAKRTDHTCLLVQIDVDEFNAEYERLPE